MKIRLYDVIAKSASFRLVFGRRLDTGISESVVLPVLLYIYSGKLVTVSSFILVRFISEVLLDCCVQSVISLTEMGTATETSMNERKVLPLSQPLLDLFWELAELNQEKQIEASVKLIRSLQQSKSDTGDASSVSFLLFSTTTSNISDFSASTGPKSSEISRLCFISTC